ncbi:MAG: LuxR family transcriptional regulator [Bacteroidia bacterium]
MHSIEAPFSLLYMSQTFADFVRDKNLTDLNLSEIYGSIFPPHQVASFFKQFKIEETNNIDNIFLNTQVSRQNTLLKKQGYAITIYKKANHLHCFTLPVKWALNQHENLNKSHAISEAKRDALSILSPKELEVLKHIAQGKSRKEISDELNISIYTYDNHRRNIKKKLKSNQFVEVTAYLKERYF